MSRFTRSGPQARPTVSQNRVFGQKVSVGEPLHIQGDAELRREIETSLEMLAKERLLEADARANEIIQAAQAEAAAALEKANAQAREMVSIAQGEVDGIREKAFEEGFKAGFEEGYTEATKQVETETAELLQGAQILAENAYHAERRILKEFEPQTLAMLEHIVRKILARELQDSPDDLMRMIDQAIESLYLSGKVKVVVSAQIIQNLREFSSRTAENLDAMKRYEFIADPALDMHQIYIIGQEGSFDISPETQARQLMEPVKKNLKLPRPEVSESQDDFSRAEDAIPDGEIPNISEPEMAALPDISDPILPETTDSAIGNPVDSPIDIMETPSQESLEDVSEPPVEPFIFPSLSDDEEPA